MNCPVCGMKTLNGAKFCDKCGASLQSTREVNYAAQQRTTSSRSVSTQDPYKDQIKQLKLQLKQLRLYLRQITTKMSSTRARYHETSAFVPFGMLSHGYKWFEDLRLLGPQQQKEQLQQQILQLEQQLLGLQQSQEEWKRQMGI
jgi:hypothetical protein